MAAKRSAKTVGTVNATLARSVAQVDPGPAARPRTLIGSVIYEGDVLSPIDDRWNAMSDEDGDHDI